MAIKAQASITLSSITDIQANYRYYLLQASTLSKPSKPTTYPPPAAWDDTEPSYTPGSDNSLYFVDCTVFSDGTFSYSEVSLSSAYEAAKDALDAANTNSEDLTAFQNAVNTTIEGLQGQIDGSIMTWFYEYVPTNENMPASEWTTTDLKNNHLGDLFYDTITGYCYRWQVQNNTYSWQRITDVDVTKALSDAAKAQDTADQKRRVFVGANSPVPPYDVGDLWAQGVAGDLMKCKVAKNMGQSFANADWEKASKYTDDTKAEQVDNKVTTLTSDFDVAKDQITALVSKSEQVDSTITEMQGDIQTAETNISTLNTNYSSIVQKTDSIEQNVSDLQTNETVINNKISGIETSISSLNSTTSSLTTDLEGITATVQEHSQDLTTVNGNITDLENRMSSAELKITPDAIIETVSDVYETKDNVSNLATRVTTAESQIETQAEQIALRATKTEMEAADNATLASAKSYADAQIEISADGIKSTVSETYATKAENEVTASAVDALDDTVNGKYEVQLDDEGNPVLDDDGNPVQIYTEGIKDSVANIEELTSDMDETVTRLDTDFGALEQRFSSVEQTANNININFGELGNDMKSWFDFSEEGVLEIGKSESPIVSRQTNESYAFVEKSTNKELLRLDTEGATVDTLNSDQLRVGRENPQWATRLGANGNLDDVWIGG